MACGDLGSHSFPKWSCTLKRWLGWLEVRSPCQSTLYLIALLGLSLKAYHRCHFSPICMIAVSIRFGTSDTSLTWVSWMEAWMQRTAYDLLTIWLASVWDWLRNCWTKVASDDNMSKTCCTRVISISSCSYSCPVHPTTGMVRILSNMDNTQLDSFVSQHVTTLPCDFVFFLTYCMIYGTSRIIWSKSFRLKSWLMHVL